MGFGVWGLVCGFEIWCGVWGVCVGGGVIRGSWIRVRPDNPPSPAKATADIQGSRVQGLKFGVCGHGFRGQDLGLMALIGKGPGFMGAVR